MTNKTIIISGPSTIGKNPLIKLIENKYHYKFVTPVTTRKIRKEEIMDRDYFFLSKEQFKNNILANNFIDWDYSILNYYGFYRNSFNPNGNRLITHSLSNMAIRLKEKNKNIFTIFIYPKNISDIIKTLKSIYTGKELTLRLNHLEREIELSSLFDMVFITNSAIKLIDNNKFIELIK